MRGRDDSVQSYELFRQEDREGWRLDAVRWGAIDSSAVSPDSVALARRAMHDEHRTTGRLTSLLDCCGDEDDAHAFVILWAHQELKHCYAFRSWLTAIGIDPGSCPQQHPTSSQDAADTPSATLVGQAVDELWTDHLYREAAARVAEPVLRGILLHAADDEASHAGTFLHHAGTRLGRHPEELPSVLRMLRSCTGDPVTPQPPAAPAAGPFPAPVEDTADTSDACCEGLRPWMAPARRRGGFDPLDGPVRRVLSGVTGLDLHNPAELRRALDAVA